MSDPRRLVDIDSSGKTMSKGSSLSKYDSLDPRTELEQTIADDLTRALEKRGFKVQPNGTPDHNALGNKPDIIVYNDAVHINVEVTKTVKSAQDGEWQSIKDHFEESKRAFHRKKCYLWFVSPETYYRTVSSIKDWNFAHKDEKDQKFLPICFSTFETFVKKLIESTREQYTQSQLLGLFDDFVQFIDDENILRQFYERLFSTDNALRDNLKEMEQERHQRVVQELTIGFLQLEQKLRDERVAMAGDAMKNVIYLVFIKLYEEKKEKEEGQRNRFTSTSFQEYQDNVRDRRTAVHKLFADIKTDRELQDCRMFTDEDHLERRLKDDFVIKHFIEPFEQYPFYTTKVDGLGAAYEVLGKSSGRDVKVGQFFTPENVVKFMVKLAELDPSEKILDPACGTARFLTYAMEDMMEKVKGARDEADKVSKIKKEHLFGTDDDPTVAKLAKMNMYIHGDGKANIRDEDGLTQFRKDGTIDVVLTNPPLGDIDYRRSIYDDEFRKTRMTVIPRNNITREKLIKAKKRIAELEQELAQPDLSAKLLQRKRKLLKTWYQKTTDLDYEIRHERSEYVITGKQMKGGALFLGACRHYLKSARDAAALPEWRGGKLLIVLDEGNLNTETYIRVRDEIKKYFYIKAIISLTRDTFVPVSSTSTKTSILFAVKKQDTDATQQEPIFFSYVDKVGIDTRKRICVNHLFNGDGMDILSKYLEFKQRVMAAYEGSTFQRTKFAELREEDRTINQTYYYSRYIDQIEERLDENYNNPRYDEIETLLAHSRFPIVELNTKEYLKHITSGKTPKGIRYLDEGGIPFLGATQITDGKVFIETAPRIDEKWHRGKLKDCQVKQGDVLVTIAGTYIGRSAVFKSLDECNCNQAVAILRVNTENLLPEYLVRYFNSELGQLFFGKFQHISNQSNINTTEITKIRVIRPPIPVQEEILKAISEKETALISAENEVKRLKEQRDRVVLDLLNLPA
jgi:type I restriction-modification system DNA methylase subunit